MRYTLEIRTPGEPARTASFGGVSSIGREGNDVDLADPAVSRRHLVLRPDAAELVVEDLGSSHGTFLRGQRISAPAPVQTGDELRLGDTVIRVVRVDLPGLASVDGPTPDGVAVSRETLAPAARPVADGMARIESPAGTVCYRAGTAGERAAPGQVAALRRARRRLAGFGSEPDGVRPVLYLVDPFPDPDDPDRYVTDGVVVDAARAEVWIVTTDEAPCEPPHRALALLFGAGLPAGDELVSLLEGYGAWLAEGPPDDSLLAGLALPPLAQAEGELRTAMLRSFVAFLVVREGEDGLRRVLSEAAPNGVDDALRRVFGFAAGELEELWRRKLDAAQAPETAVGEFVRLAGQFLRPHWRRQAEIFVWMLLGLAFTMALPFITRRLVDDALPSGKMSEVTQLLAVLGGAFVVSMLANLRRAHQSAYVSGAVVRDLRIELFGRLQHLPARWYQRHQQGDVLSRVFTDVGLVEAGVSQVVRDGAFQALTLVVSAVIMLRLNLLLGAVVLLALPLLALVYRLMSDGARSRSLAVQEETSGLLNVASENYHAERVVKVFGLADRELGRFTHTAGRLFRAQRRLSLYGGVFSLSVSAVVIALRIGVLALGAWLVTEGRLSIGGLVAFLGVMSEAINPVTALTTLGQQLQTASGALVRVQQLLAESPEGTGPSSGAEAAETVEAAPLGREIRFDHVSYSYAPGSRALEDVDVVIPAGTRAAFVGPSGSGKSTILGLLMRLDDPEEGRILYDGADLRELGVGSFRSQLGVVLQDSFLFDTSVRENIALGKPGAGADDVEAAARAAEAHAFVAAAPRGYDTSVGERGARLSGGQRQRVAIARALVRDPSLLLLDEATSALDPATERQISGTLARAGEGRTVVAITHRLTSVVDYDRIFVVVAGRIVETGTHAELLALGGTYAELWAEQTGGAFAAPDDTSGLDDVLAHVPILVELGPADRAALLASAVAAELAPGETVHEEPGRLVVVARGCAELVGAGLSGREEVLSELGPGAVFGLRAVLGEPSGAWLRAQQPTRVVSVDVQRFVGAGRAAGPVTGTAAPAGGRRLTRSTVAVRFVPSVVPSDDELVGREVRRLTGSIQAVR
jgi:ABC-type multidrug transport system fused ATPase/permease subunit